MTWIRPFQPGDEAALSDICLKTADAGADATGVLDDDDLWAEIFVLPYAARHPEFVFVVETDDRVAGYIVGVPDTREFETTLCGQFSWHRPILATVLERADRCGGLLLHVRQDMGVGVQGDFDSGVAEPLLCRRTVHVTAGPR